MGGGVRVSPSRQTLIGGWVALAVAVVILGLGAHGLHRASVEATPADVPVAAVDARLAGRWVSPSGRRILITRTGAVWADPDLLGQVASVSPGRIVLAGETFSCSYAVAFPAPDVTEWTLQDRTGRTPCPTGRFERSFTF